MVLVLLDLRFCCNGTLPSSAIVGISSTRMPRPADEFRAGGALLDWYCWSGRKTSKVDGRCAVAELVPLLFILGDAAIMVVTRWYEELWGLKTEWRIGLWELRILYQGLRPAQSFILLEGVIILSRQTYCRTTPARTKRRRPRLYSPLSPVLMAFTDAVCRNG